MNSSNTSSTALPVATGNKVLRAYNQAIKKLTADDGLWATEVSAGFIIPTGQKRGHRKGYQVFLKVCRYDDQLAATRPLTGGLLSNTVGQLPPPPPPYTGAIVDHGSTGAPSHTHCDDRTAAEWAGLYRKLDQTCTKFTREITAYQARILELRKSRDVMQATAADRFNRIRYLEETLASIKAIAKVANEIDEQKTSGKTFVRIFNLCTKALP